MRTALSLTAAAALAWLVRYLIAEYGAFAELPLVRDAVEMAALGLTGVLAVQVAGWLLAELVLRDLLHLAPTGLSRVLIYVGLSLAVGIPILAYFGVNLAALLTTSAIIGAVMGLALQQPLNNLISGLSLSSDGLLQSGATLWYQGMPMEVVALNWRHVVARRPDNVLVAMPNTMLASETLTVLPEDRPTRCEITFDLPSNVPPDCVSSALDDSFTDMPDLDTSQPVTVQPAATHIEFSAITYRVRAWVRRYSDRERIEGELLRRAWYVLERAGIPFPRSELFQLPELSDGDLHALLAAAFPSVSHEALEHVAEQSTCYRFATDERVVFPPDCAGRAVAIVRGTACAHGTRYLDPLEHGRAAATHLPAHPPETLSVNAQLRTVAARLAEEIGPVAERVVQDAVAQSHDRDDLIARVSAYLSEPRAQEQMQALVTRIREGNVGPGHLDWLRVDVAGRAVTKSPIKAMTELTVAVIDEDAERALMSNAP